MSIASISLTMIITLTPLASSDNDLESKIVFRSGGSLDGKVISETKESGRNYLVARLDGGTTLKLDKGRVVRRVLDDGRNDPQYLATLSGLSNTAEAHAEMYQWCKNNGGNSKFADQMKFHLKQIVKLDPSDSKAWQLLEYIKVDGRWVPEQQHFLSLGYVKSKGRWISQTQLETNRHQEAATVHLNARKKALKSWQKNILKVKDLPTIRDELGKILDPACVGYFRLQYMDRQKDPELRRLFVDAIADVKSNITHQILVEYAIADEDYEVREHAMLMLENDSFDQMRSVNWFAKHLSSTNNQIVNRAGNLIGRLKNDVGIVPLIGALVTKHKLATGDDPNRMNMQFGNQGTGFGTGGPSTVIKTFKNDGVRQALYDITGQDFGFDSDVWKQWYVDQHTALQTDLRRRSGN